MSPLLDKILRAGEGRQLRALEKIVAEVNSFEASISPLSDDQLRGKTEEFKARLAKGETFDDLLPEAYAVVREAAKRTLGQRHYDVQIMGGAALHLGNIAEMRTGEGKTLVELCPHTSMPSLVKVFTSLPLTITSPHVTVSGWDVSIVFLV